MPLRPENNFLVELDQLPEEMLRRAKVVYVNYPNNPTAAIAPRDYLERLVAACRTHGIVLAYDNAYCDITFDGYVAPSIFEMPGARDVAVEFFSMSKSFQMTGWRVGFAIGNAQLIGALTKVKSYVDTGPFLALQQASAWTLDHAEELNRPIVDELTRRRDAAVAALTRSGLHCRDAARCDVCLGAAAAGIPSATFTTRALEEEGVVALPGSGFGPGGEGFFRIALTVPPDRMREAVTRLGRTLAACGKADRCRCRLTAAFGFRVGSGIRWWLWVAGGRAACSDRLSLSCATPRRWRTSSLHVHAIAIADDARAVTMRYQPGRRPASSGRPRPAPSAPARDVTLAKPVPAHASVPPVSQNVAVLAPVALPVDTPPHGVRQRGAALRRRTALAFSRCRRRRARSPARSPASHRPS